MVENAPIVTTPPHTTDLVAPEQNNADQKDLHLVDKIRTKKALRLYLRYEAVLDRIFNGNIRGEKLRNIQLAHRDTVFEATPYKSDSSLRRSRLRLYYSGTPYEAVHGCSLIIIRRCAIIYATNR